MKNYYNERITMEELMYFTDKVFRYYNGRINHTILAKLEIKLDTFNMQDFNADHIFTSLGKFDEIEIYVGDLYSICNDVVPMVANQIIKFHTIYSIIYTLYDLEYDTSSYRVWETATVDKDGQIICTGADPEMLEACSAAEDAYGSAELKFFRMQDIKFMTANYMLNHIQEIEREFDLNINTELFIPFLLERNKPFYGLYERITPLEWIKTSLMYFVWGKDKDTVSFYVENPNLAGISCIRLYINQYEIIVYRDNKYIDVNEFNERLHCAYYQYPFRLVSYGTELEDGIYNIYVKAELKIAYKPKPRLRI